jgi:thiol-disulfide isomerase/thioredoxin
MKMGRRDWMKMGLSRAVILAVVLCLPAAGWAAFSLSHLSVADGNKPPEMPEFTPTAPKLPAPEIVFADDAGKPATLRDFRGRVVLVNLWATWCQPCIREMPALDRLAADMAGKDFTIVLVSQDRGGAPVVDPFFQKLGLAALRTYLDPKSTVGQAFGVRGLPTSVLIDRDGNELGRVEGAAAWDGATAKALLRWYVERDATPPDAPVKAAAE